jgi:hypothetical protein
MNARSSGTNDGGIFFKTILVTGEENDVLEMLLCEQGRNV